MPNKPPNPGICPLQGVRIIELGGDLASAYCARLLGDYGAEVITIRAAEGEARDLPALRRRLDDFLSVGKKQVRLGSHPNADLLIDICRSAEAVILSDPVGLTGRFGLPLERIKSDLPDHDILVFTPNGLDTAMAGEGAAPITVAHGSGYTWHQSNPTYDIQNVPPHGVALHEAEFGTGVQGVSALLAARRNRRRGLGRSVIDLSVRDFLGQFLIEQVSDYGRGVRDFGRAPQSGGRQVAGGLVFILKCADGWLLVSPREDHQWARWMDALGNPAFASDDALCGTREKRNENASELQRLMGQVALTKSRADLFGRARERRVPCFPLNTPDDLRVDSQLHARGFFDTLATEGRMVLAPGSPFSITMADGRALAKSRQLVPGKETSIKDVLPCSNG